MIYVAVFQSRIRTYRKTFQARSDELAYAASRYLTRQESWSLVQITRQHDGETVWHIEEAMKGVIG